MKPYKIILTSIILLSLGQLFGQSPAKYSDKYLKKHPVWIEMIQQENANYFEVIHAFDLFWEGKDKPMEEEELLGPKFAAKEKRKESFVREIFKGKEEAAEKYAFEYKRFMHWKMQVTPFVQTDGRILTKDEILKIWEQEKKRPQAGK